MLEVNFKTQDVCFEEYKLHSNTSETICHGNLDITNSIGIVFSLGNKRICGQGGTYVFSTCYHCIMQK
jgi:hypothetical protein